jgi:hypothetical protein
MSEIPCELVIKHEGVLGMMASDVSHIRKKVDNGLSTELSKVSGELYSVEKALADFIAATGVKDEKENTERVSRQAKNDAENWFTRIVTGSVTKIIGYIVIFIIANSFVNGGVGLYLKERYSQETAGQQRGIMQKTTDIQSLLSGYHTHALADGRTLFHTGDPKTPAYIFNPLINLWEKAPTMRTEDGKR